MLNQATLSELRARLDKREISSRELTQACLDRIDAVDDRVHAFLECDKDAALAQADAADKTLAAGAAVGPLHGIPMAVKDVLARKGERLTCASKILEGFV